jgi:hypothetical protein
MSQSLTPEVMPDRIAPEHREELAIAARHLENPGFIARLTDLVGTPVEATLSLLPPRARAIVDQATGAAVEGALAVAVASLGDDGGTDNPGLAAVGVTGAVGGFFGLPGLLVELPLTTALMLRGIADIARANGENLTDPETRFACLEVFAMGGGRDEGAAAETGYYAVRYLLAGAVSEAASHVAAKGLTQKGAPVLARLTALIAGRFGAAVSEKVAAQALPVVGAVGGAAINTLFMDHFRKTARSHFTVRRLERRYGPDPVRAVYEALATR